MMLSWVGLVIVILAATTSGILFGYVLGHSHGRSVTRDAWKAELDAVLKQRQATVRRNYPNLPGESP